MWKKEEAEEMLLLLCVQSIYLNAAQMHTRNTKTTHPILSHPIPVRSHLITTNRLRFYYECVHIVVVVDVGFVHTFRIVKFTRVLTSNQIESHFSTISVSFGNAINSNVCVCNLKAFDTSCKYMCVCACLCVQSFGNVRIKIQYVQGCFFSLQHKKATARKNKQNQRQRQQRKQIFITFI